METALYLEPTAWARLGDLVINDKNLPAALDLKPNPFTGRVGVDELVECLGGKLNVWPSWARPIIEAGDVDTALRSHTGTAQGQTGLPGDHPT